MEVAWKMPTVRVDDGRALRPIKTTVLVERFTGPIATFCFVVLLPTGSEERGVLRVGSIPVEILPSCPDKIAL